MNPFGGTRPPFSQYDTGAGDASTWHSSETSDPSGAPRSWLGARTDGATVNNVRNFSTSGEHAFQIRLMAEEVKIFYQVLFSMQNHAYKTHRMLPNQATIKCGRMIFLANFF